MTEYLIQDDIPEGIFNNFMKLEKIAVDTELHGLKDLHLELLGIQMEKEQQQTNWAESDLSQNQLKYAANDVLRLLEIFERLQKMIISRNRLPGGKSISELNETAQSMLPGMVELLVHGYGDLDRGWQTSLFSH